MCQAAAIDDVLAQHPRDAGVLVQLLQDVQRKLHYLPNSALREVAEYLQVPLAKVYSVATFYKSFSLVPKGEHVVRVCTGTACHVRGASLVVDELQQKLAIAPGQTTKDMKFTLDVVNCVGACALAPVVMIDDEVHGAVTPAKAVSVLPKSRSKQS